MRRACNRHRRSEAGFTLIEAVSAVAILGIGVAVLIRLFSGGLTLARASSAHTGAAIVAEALMGEATVSFEPGERTVERDGYDCTVRTALYTEVPYEVDGSTVYRISVSVKSPSGGSYEAETLRTSLAESGPADPDGL